MNVVEFFNKHFGNQCPILNDFFLVEFESNIMVGVDKDSNIAVVLKSAPPKRFPLKHKTKNMSIECNVNVRYELAGKSYSDTVHIIRCLSSEKREKELFLELSMVLIQESDYSEESIMDTFGVLRSFFDDKKEFSDTELIGLYAELHTIITYHDTLEIEKYWQSRDRMKFDFSFSPKVKLEVKATTKNSRAHHFRHEQLMTQIYDVFVLSYLLRFDDEGLSLYELLLKSKEYLKTESSKLLRIDRVLKNTSEDRLKSMKFNNDYTVMNRHFYRAIDIPKFNECTPAGVTNAEYDCVLDTVPYITDDNFITIIKKQQ